MKGVKVDSEDYAGLSVYFMMLARSGTSVLWSDISGANAGGIVGGSSGTIQSCYYTGTVERSLVAGGIVGNYKNGTVTNCYYLMLRKRE